jgi:hypothetical protein
MAALDFPSSPTVGQQYAAPNGVTYQWDGAAWVVTGGPPGQLWTGAGATLTPTDPSKTVALAPVTNPLTWSAGRVVKGRLIAASGADNVQLSMNRAADGTEDDNTKPGWYLSLGPGDLCTIGRAPAGSTSGATLATVTAAGLMSTASDLVSGGSISTGGITTAPTAPGVRVTGTSAGLRCQGVGTAVADGYSNAIAFGWNGSLQARVDSTALGSVNMTPPSDERLKRDVREDVPGLAAVCALRPISYAYDQTKREVGFPAGRHYGLIAQEAHALVPLAIDDDGTEEHVLSIDYRELVPVLLQAVKELVAHVATLTTPPPANA